MDAGNPSLRLQPAARPPRLSLGVGPTALFRRRVPMAQAEERKIIAEYIKHLSTLATGSLVLLITFLEKLTERPQWKIAVIIALIAFLLSILGGVLVYTMPIVASQDLQVGRYRAREPGCPGCSEHYRFRWPWVVMDRLSD